jgi:pseudouridine-5'-phosphate glycosidase
MKQIHIEIHPEVQKALKENIGVVALESTIISHGMPYPDNVKMALAVEEIIKNEGAVPATIAILNGTIKIGLSSDEIEYLAQAKDVYKVSKRDFSYVISKGLTGATTVSGTALISQLAQIPVFATGGIGGVHRGAETSFDISRDLEELSEVDICVVCAGAKSILDLGLTMEYLETKGVEVIGYQTEILPAFYTRTSDYHVNYKLDTPEEIANLMSTKWNLGLKGGIIVANPIPKAYDMNHEVIKKAIEEAVLEANQKGIKGNLVTPFLLSKIKSLTEGLSLDSNIELVKNNAQLAAQIAVSYAKTK